MSPTTGPLPKRPRGAERAQANRSFGARPGSTRAGGLPTAPVPDLHTQTSGATVTTPAAPEPTSRASGRRAAQRAPRPSRARPSRPHPPHARLQLPAVPGPALSTRAAAMPIGVVALVTCFLVAASTPAQAAADATGVAVSVRASDPTASGASQAFTAPVGSSVAVVRDGFAVGSAPMPGVSVGGGDAVRPVDGSVPTAGGFGSRWVRGCGACSTNHQGLDFAAASGSPAVAAMPGRVVAAGVLGGYGNQVLVQHASGVQTRYGHLSAIDVRVGQVVAAGERVGAVGSTGVSTGPHLHFEVIVDGRPVDPADWLRARGLL